MRQACMGAKFSYVTQDCACRALLAKDQHKLNEVLREAAAARAHRAVAPEATYLMVEAYLRPVVDSLWAGEAVGADAAESAVATCDHLLGSMDAAQRSTTRWQVFNRSFHACCVECISSRL